MLLLPAPPTTVKSAEAVAVPLVRATTHAGRIGSPATTGGGEAVNWTTSAGAAVAFRFPLTGTMSRAPVPGRARLPAAKVTLTGVPGLSRALSWITAPPPTV